KGGVGKTTLTAALAVRAAQERDGKARIAIVDLDPQKSLAKWWNRRPRLKDDESPQILTGVDEANDAVERAHQVGYDWIFLDGPPAFLTTIKQMIAEADFVLVPIKPSTADLQAAEDVIALARKGGKQYRCVFNDVGRNEKVADKIRADLFGIDLRIAKKNI